MKGTMIIGGELRRHRMGSVPAGLNTRPILARIKKSLFDILRNRIAGSKFLDLFAGSGSVGLEALSRGSSKVIFVDANPYCARWIEQTLASIGEKHQNLMGLGEHAVYRHDLMKGLSWVGSEFDLIFSGAPYVDHKKRPLHFVQFLLEEIAKAKILSAEGWFIAQHSTRETFTAPAGWDFFRQEKYGDTALSFFRHAQ